MLRRLFAVLIVTAGVSGCGSVRTLDSEAHESVSDLKLGRTYCTELPRIYSGVAYNFCALHGDPGGSYQRSAGLSPPLPDSPRGSTGHCSMACFPLPPIRWCCLTRSIGSNAMAVSS